MRGSACYSASSSRFCEGGGLKPDDAHPAGSHLRSGFGIIFGLVSYWMTGGKRDFLSRSQIIAHHYDVHVTTDGLADARKILGLTAQWPPPVDGS